MNNYEKEQAKKYHICDEKCIYFPRGIDKDLNYQYNENGIKLRFCSPEYVCEFDNHIIYTWKPCQFYKTLEDVKWTLFDTSDVGDVTQDNVKELEGVV